MFGEERNSPIQYKMSDTKKLQEIRSESSQEQPLISTHFFKLLKPR